MKLATHNIAIPTIMEVGKNNLSNIGHILSKRNLNDVAIFFGDGIRNLFGHVILDSLEQNSIKVSKIYENDTIDICSIYGNAFSLPIHTQVIIGIGGGKVLDVAKYTCFLNGLPFISVPTSTSNDGFSSSGSSLIIEGRRTSVPAKIPYGIIVDIDVIKVSPERYIYSGIGDLISKFTALYDWEFEEHHGKTIVNAFAAMVARKSVESFTKMDFKTIRDDHFIKELVDSLTLSGIAMEIAGSSAPASGSEHLISHSLDKILEVPNLHGIQVGISTYLMCKVQNHMVDEVTKFFTDTGFFNFVKTLNIKSSDFKQAIDLAPSIKPHRYTHIHLEEHRNMAKKLLDEDPILTDILS